MKKILTVATALGFLMVLEAPQNAEARPYISLQFGVPAPQPYYVPYYVGPSCVVPQPYYYPIPQRHCYQVPSYTPWGVVYHTECY